MGVTGFGDYMIHFSPQAQERFWQADSMRLSYTGAAANVCAALAFWGEDTAFVTRLPENPLARRAVASLDALRIDTRHIAWGGKRMGIFFLETGASVRSSQVIYDREHSGFTESSPSDYDFDAILDTTDILYLTGITPALSASLQDCCLQLCGKAQVRGIPVVYDINYRPALWYADAAGAFLKAIAPFLTCLIGNEEHLKQLLGLHSDYGEESREDRLYDIIDQVRSLLSVPKIAVTVRRTISASDAIVYAAYCDGRSRAVSAQHRVHVVDRVGSGDAFAAGLIYAQRHQYSAAEAVAFAAASNAMKHTILSDVNFATVDEIHAVNRPAWQDVKR